MSLLLSETLWFFIQPCCIMVSFFGGYINYVAATFRFGLHAYPIEFVNCVFDLHCVIPGFSAEQR